MGVDTNTQMKIEGLKNDWFFIFTVKYSNRNTEKNCIQMQNNLSHIFKTDIVEIYMYTSKNESSNIGFLQ